MRRTIPVDFNDNCSIGATKDKYFFDEEPDFSGWSKKEKYELLERCMKSGLTEKQRRCLIMYYFENKKIPEIAEELELNKSTVSRHINAARRKIQKLFWIAKGDRLH